MRTRDIGWAGMVLALVALVPAGGRAQDALGGALPDWYVPSPLGGDPFTPEDGVYFNGSFLLYRQTVPLEDQTVAVRGFVDIDGSATGAPGTIQGSFREALNTGQATGPGSYQPGFGIGLGYRFRDGSAIEAHWMHLTTLEYSAVATLVPPGFNPRGDLTDSFLFSPVFNFPVEFAGPLDDVRTGVAAFGVWNAADVMTLSYQQRNELFDLTYRKPIHETENWRTYGLIGPRFVWFWEKFKWRTTDLDATGNGAPVFEAVYSNIVSNRMYGMKIGCGNECYLGNGFSVALDLQSSLLLNVVKERVKYERGDRNQGPERKRSLTDYTVVPELRATLNLWWFPTQNIQVKFGYDAMAFFNTVSSEIPISFNYSAVDPGYDRVFRLLDGLEIGIALKF